MKTIPWRLFDFKYDVSRLQLQIENIIEKNKWNESPFTWPIYNSKWLDVSNILTEEIVESVESTIGSPIKRNCYWLWYYNDSVELKPHIDKLFNGCKYGVVLPIKGTFSLTSYTDDNHLYNWIPGIEEQVDVSKLTVVDTVTYSPGQFIVLNNTVYPHSGIATDQHRITLHLYLEDNNYE